MVTFDDLESRVDATREMNRSSICTIENGREVNQFIEHYFVRTLDSLLVRSNFETSSGTRRPLMEESLRQWIDFAGRVNLLDQRTLRWGPVKLRVRDACFQAAKLVIKRPQGGSLSGNGD